MTAHKVQVPHVSGQLSVQVQKKDPEKKRMFKLFFIHVRDFEKKEAVRSFLKKRLVNGSSQRERESEGFVSLESSKEIIFETNFAKGEQNPLEEKEEEENRPIVRVLINFAAFFNPTGKLPLKRESSEKLFIECQNFPP